MKIIFTLIFFLVTYCYSFSQYKSDFNVTGDLNPFPQTYPVCDYSANRFITIWKDGRENSERSYIYLQLYDMNGLPLGANQRANIFGDSLTSNHVLKIRKDGSFVIGWTSYQSNQENFLLRIFDNMGNPTSSPLKINDTTYYTSGYQNGLSLDVDSNKNIYTASCYRLSETIPSFNIYFQKFDSLGNRTGSRILVNDDINNAIQDMPVIKVRRDGSFVIVWMDKRDSGTGAGNIYMQMFSSIGVRIGTNKRINDDDPVMTHHQNPDIACDSLGNFTVVWEDLRINDIWFNIFGQAFDAAGNAVGSNFKIDDGLTLWLRSYPKIAMKPNGEYAVTWTDEDGPNPTTSYFKRFRNFNQPIGTQKKVSSQASTNNKFLPNVCINKDRMYFAWMDNRNNDDDIYCNILSFQNPDSVVSSINTTNQIKLSQFHLSQNYPNPFNPSTKISFYIPENEVVSLKVYNINGKEVDAIINKEFFNRGNYERTFNGEEQPSGIYFYKLEAGNFSESKKMILLK